jgi:hypothetical protein
MFFYDSFFPIYCLGLGTFLAKRIAFSRADISFPFFLVDLIVGATFEACSFD